MPEQKDTTYLIRDLTRYRDRLKEVHETMSDPYARKGASFSRVDDTLSLLAFYHRESEVGKLLEEIKQWFYECQFHDKPVSKEATGE
jgi:hypothetical protein